jgi:6-phosphogluconolactonase (cycloisomerase 2 family)
MNNQGKNEAGGRPAGSVVYIVTNPSGPNAVDAFTRDPATGQIAYQGRYETGGQGDPFAGGFESHALVGDRRYVYAVNPGSDTISAFAVQNGGSLRLLGAVPSGGRRPVSLALHGNLLYVANEGNIPGSPPEDLLPGSYAGFRVREDGRLEPIAGSTVPLQPGDSPGEILFNHDGTRLIACRLGGNLIDSFHVRPDGHLERGAELRGQPGPFGSTFSPTHPTQLIVTLAGAEAGPPAPGVASYSLTEEGLRPISVVTDAALKDPCWAAITPDGKRLWASSFIPRSLTLYSIDDQGRLTQQSSYIPADGPGSTDIALDPAGRFLYQLRAFDVVRGRSGSIVPQIAVLEVTGGAADGGLRPVQSLSLSTDLDRAGVTGILVVDLE